MNIIVMLGTNISTLLEIYEQCCAVGHERHDIGHEYHDVGHERQDVVGFSSDGKVVKIQSLGLLLPSKLFLLHINHHRSSHDHIHKEQHWI